MNVKLRRGAVAFGFAPFTPAWFQGTAVTRAGTTNTTTAIMMGLPGTITPSYSGRIFVMASGAWYNNTGGWGGQLVLLYGTGIKPANGDTAVGSAFGSSALHSNMDTNVVTPWSVCGITTGLTIGTAYWLDVALKAWGGGTIKLMDNICAISAFEF
jgi:hypothetical protein